MRPDPERPRYVTVRSPCPHHHGRCAFYGDEPGRCPRCHTTWARVESCGCNGCGRSREHHLAVHQRKDEEARNAATRRSEAVHVPASTGGTS